MKKALSIALSLSMLVGLSTFRGSTSNEKTDISGYLPQERIISINKDAVTEKLMEDGKLNRNATQDEITKALQDYVGLGGVKSTTTKYEKMAEAAANKKIQAGLTNAAFSGKKLGQGSTIPGVTETKYNDPVKTVKVLVLLGDYADYTHNSIVKPDLTKQYWTEDFNAEHYKQLLFGDGFYTTKEGIKSPTFKEYFKDMSNGNLNIEGNVYGWYNVSKNAADYGKEINEDTHDADPRSFVIELTKEAVKNGVNLSDYDIEDPYDLDGDGNLDEPDGIVDHLMVIHAGVGQEEGGGILGKDAIWSHSWDVGVNPVEIEGTNMSIYPYTIEAENGAVGVFCHEFVHDLGMPDDYDTQYTADGDIVEYWSIMSSGSWAGKPAGTMPTAINPYSRILLGLIHGGNWINWGSIKYSDLKSGTSINTTLDTASMSTGNLQAVLINLPKDANKILMNTPMTGTNEFWGGTGAEIDHNMTAEVDLTGKTSANLTYNIWYDIEENWDAGFIQISEDGKNFKSIKTPYTVDDFNNKDAYPTIMDSYPAYTGSSNGWLSENIDLSAYAGKKIWIRFRYATDWGTELKGMFLDNINVTADGAAILSEGAENGFGSFTNNGFETNNGTKSGSHYYIAEWRSYIGVDQGLQHIAKADIKYNRGLLLWYKNTLYTDNFVGVHPGRGQLGVVDANQQVYMNNCDVKGYFGAHWPFIQLQNAAFSRDKAADMNLSVYSWANTVNLNGKQAVPVFNDSNSYYTSRSYASGLKLPNLGLSIKVTGNAADYSRGAILINKK